MDLLLLSNLNIKLDSKNCLNIFFSQELGVGSYSVCKKCVHKATGVEYAVKVTWPTFFLRKSFIHYLLKFIIPCQHSLV